MQIRNPELWAALVDTQPLATVRAAEFWADIMERWIDTAQNPTPRAALVLGALVCTRDQIRPLAPTDAQYGAVLNILLQCWQHGGGVLALLEVDELKRMTT